MFAWLWSNNRKILSGIGELLVFERLTDITVAIDKIDKIGIDGVNSESGNRAYQVAIEKLQPVILLKGNKPKNPC